MSRDKEFSFVRDSIPGCLLRSGILPHKHLLWGYMGDGVSRFILKRKKEMVTAHVLLNVRRDKVHEVAEILADIEGIAEVYSVGGRFDLVAVIRVKGNEKLEDIVTNHIRGVEGITKSETLIAFRVYSRHDLERMFAIGMNS
jgi:DNA-binding Lrp family transcriptional regulator